MVTGNDDRFRITVLGSSGSYAGPDNPCTGFVVRSPGATVLLDFGPGTLGPLQDTIDLADLDAVVLTHCHPDHWLELPVLRNVLLFFQPVTPLPLPVYGTAETFRMNREVTVPVDGRDEPFEWTVIDEHSKLRIEDQVWTFRRTDHPVETLASQVDVGGRTIMYTADTGPGWHFDSFPSGIDLVLADASHTAALENRGIPHLSAREAATRAREAEVGRLVLTHLVPGSDADTHRAEAEEAYGGGVEIATPGATFEV